MQHIADLTEFAPDYDGLLTDLLTLLHQIAVMQAVPGAALGEEMDEKTVERLAATLSAEDVQLFYQIGLIGRRDLVIAPSARLGFEMVLLRMLAYRPLAPTNGSQASPASSPQKEPHAVTIKQPPTRPSRDAFPLSEPRATNSTDEINDINWHQLVDRLSLQGMVSVLANNCALIHREANTLHLALAPAHASLRNNKLEERLQEALSSHLGEQVKLVFNVTQPSAETPAAIQERASQDRLRSAQEAIARDNHVKALQDMFDARIVPESIRPVD